MKTNYFEVCLVSPGGSPITIVVVAHNSQQARDTGRAMYPRFTVASTRDLGSR